MNGLVDARAAEIALHHRLEPMTSRDRSTCGYKTELGKLFTQHIAEALSDLPGVRSSGGEAIP